ncbi:uncharacterized protein C18orf63 homolog [Chaetodon auriga]|uniref:uncharacterized protein C18orf63 homolog n=1 Tax=Chaetodon auriga TaxID=39042 RepID=UPI004032DC7F
MSAGVQQSMVFLGLPDLKKLVCVTLTLQEEEEELRSKQIKTCRELILLYSDVLASPALDSFAEITVVMAVQFFQRGVLQLFGRRRSLQLGSPQCVFPGVLQCCLSFSLITRLSPSWNKAGLFLISGKDFLSERGRLSAASVELSTSQGQLCISIQANAVTLPPTTLQDFDLPPLVLSRFCSDPDSVLDLASTGGAVWCHVLPSMKKGQIISISRRLPRDGPFRTYRDLQNHWNCLYGYRLPELAEEEVVYCSVYFRLVGERLFTYPLSCVRLQPVQRRPRADLQGALSSFLSDIRERLQSVCGFPARLTSKPCYHTAGLNTAAQVLSGEQVDQTTSSSSIRPVLTQLPAPPPPPHRPTKPPASRSQPPAWAPPSQQDGAQGLLGNGCGFRSSLSQSQECRGNRHWPSSSSSSRVSFSFSDSLAYRSPPSSSFSFSFSSSSSSSLPLFQPASSLLSSSVSSSSSVLSSLPPLSQTPVIPAPKLVPVFKNKCPSRHLSVALLRLHKQKEQLSGGGEERGRVTIPAVRKKTPAAVSSSSASSVSAAALPPPTIPSFNRGPKPRRSAAPQPAAHPKVKHVGSLSPAPESKAGLILAPKLEIKFKSNLKTSMDAISAADASDEVQERTTKQPSAGPQTSSDSSGKDTSTSSRRPKKSRSAVRDVDVEKMARSSQLSRLNSGTLSAWLTGRGVLVSAKHTKEELMLKVMSCLAEA